MKIDLTDIARGRRIVAITARDLALTRKSDRPEATRRVLRLLRRVIRRAPRA